jgi:hypothetical protein
MIINIIGNLIDTKKIYRISPLNFEKNKNWSCSFTIFFFNKNFWTIKFNCNIEYYEGNSHFYLGGKRVPFDSAEFSEKTKKEIIEFLEATPEFVKFKFQMEEFRNKIVEYWDSSKSPIPSIELVD